MASALSLAAIVGSHVPGIIEPQIDLEQPIGVGIGFYGHDGPAMIGDWNNQRANVRANNEGVVIRANLTQQPLKLVLRVAASFSDFPADAHVFGVCREQSIFRLTDDRNNIRSAKGLACLPDERRQ